MSVDLERRLFAAAQFRWRAQQEGGIILDTGTGEVFRLNRSAMRMWQLLMEGLLMTHGTRGKEGRGPRGNKKY